MKVGHTIEEIRSTLESICIYSSHEHVKYERQAVLEVRNRDYDLLGLFMNHYTRSDFLSAGAKDSDLVKISNTSIDFETRHASFLEFALRCKNTSQFRCLREGLTALYGGDVLELHSARKMNDEMYEMYGPGVYDNILRDRARITRLVRDCGEDFKESERFSYAVRLEQWLGASNVAAIRALEEKHDISITKLDDFLSGFELHAKKLVKDGAVAFKNAIIYQRHPKVDLVTRAEADQAFNRMMQTRYAEWLEEPQVWLPELKCFQDFLLHHLCEIAQELEVPVQIHTGIPEGNVLPFSRGNPDCLIDLVLAHPRVNFHLLHMGHPYEREACAMAKMYSNVWLDCSWAHHLNQYAAKFFLGYALDEVPQWKIIGFGGDYAHAEGIFSAARFARNNFATVLFDRLRLRQSSDADLFELASLLMHENAQRAFTRSPVLR